MFVRLVSHEIRTPLNVVVVGLKLIGRELTALNCNADLMDTVKDAGVSCDAAIDLLDDLLAYEKLEAGIMVLERSEIPAWDFICDAVQPFSIQVSSFISIFLTISLFCY